MGGMFWQTRQRMNGQTMNGLALHMNVDFLLKVIGSH